MDTFLERIADYGVLGAICAFLLYVGYAKVLPLWKDTVIALQKALETLQQTSAALGEHLEWARKRNGKTGHGGQ